MKGILKRKITIKCLLCIIWLGIIFYNTTRQGEISQRYSGEVTKIISVVINIPSAILDKHNIKFSDVNFYVRKNAHFFQYLILSIMLCSAVRQIKLYKTSEIFLLLFLLLFISVTDEFIQKYIPGRTSSILDIVIDFSGGVLGMLISNIGYKIRKKKVAVQA